MKLNDLDKLDTAIEHLSEIFKVHPNEIVRIILDSNLPRDGDRSSIVNYYGNFNYSEN